MQNLLRMVPKLMSSTGANASIQDEKGTSRTNGFVKHVEKGKDSHLIRFAIWGFILFT